MRRTFPARIAEPLTIVERPVFVGSILAVVMLAGCNPLGSMTAAHYAEPLRLVRSDPAQGAANVSRTVTPTLFFSTILDAYSATPENVTLRSSAGLVDASITTAVDRMTVTPAQRLAIWTTYSLQLGTGLRGNNGTNLPDVETISFQTVDGAWGAPELIESGTGAASRPKTAFDAGGNAIAVWTQRDGAIEHLYANRYVQGSGWGAAQQLDSGSSNATSHQVAVDLEGNAIAVWRQHDGTIQSLYANRYTAGAGWSTPQLIENGGTVPSDPQIAMDAGGNATVVWRQHDGTAESIYANRYTVGAGWGTEQLLENDSNAASSPQVAVDARGNAMAVWSQTDGTEYSIYTRRYTAGVGWSGAPELIENNGGNAETPQIAFDVNGNAIVVWRQSDASTYRIYANRHVADSAWNAAAAQLLETDSRTLSEPKLALDAGGNAMAIWLRNAGTSVGIRGSRYTAGAGWSDPWDVKSGAGYAYGHQIALDASGNALVVWSQEDDSNGSVYVSRDLLGTNPGSFIMQLDESGNAYADSPHIAVDALGQAFAVWRQGDGPTANIYARRFD